LISIEGIGNLTKLDHLMCFNNKLISLDGIENLKKLEILYCGENKLSKEYEKYLKSLKIDDTDII